MRPQKPHKGAELFLGNAGTAMRPLTAAVAAAGRGTFVLDGVARMRERPIADLVDGLVQLGVKASCTMGTGCPPVTVEAEGLPAGKVGWTVKRRRRLVGPDTAVVLWGQRTVYFAVSSPAFKHQRPPTDRFCNRHPISFQPPQVQLSGSVSSQYLTALLMAAPLSKGDGIEIVIKDELVSQPYVDMTVKLMRRFGVEVQLLDGLTHMKIRGGQT
jgi:5-enolpyruvylshikimate-3-phosphate synthase